MVLTKDIREKAREVGKSPKEYLMDGIRKHGSMAKFARAIGVTRQRLRYVCRVYGVSSAWWGLSASNREVLSECFLMGMGDSAISDLTGYDLSRILKYRQQWQELWR